MLFFNGINILTAFTNIYEIILVFILHFYILHSGRNIRHRACALRDTTQAIIEAELDPDFEKTCEEILQSIKARGKEFIIYCSRQILYSGERW